MRPLRPWCLLKPVAIPVGSDDYSDSDDSTSSRSKKKKKTDKAPIGTQEGAGSDLSLSDSGDSEDDEVGLAAAKNGAGSSS